MLHRLLQTTFISTALLCVCAVSVSAQVSTTRGFHVGFQLQAAAVSVEGGDADTGGGAALRAGYGFNRIVTGFIGAAGASVNAINQPNVAGVWETVHVDFGARFHFANTLRQWVPYLEAALSARAMRVGGADVDGAELVDNITRSGGAFTFGGGMAVFLSEQFALDFGLDISTGEFTDISGDFRKLQGGRKTISGFDIDATSSRFGFGFQYWF